MEKQSNIYDPSKDEMFQKPYIDIDEWREGAVKFHYIHGGFEGTEVKFAFFFPTKDNYKGRFFHFMCPVPANENAAMAGDGEKITFAIQNGAYFVESNMGVAASFGPIADPTIIYRSSAAVAEYSRVVAATLFGNHRPIGVIFGGSGGGFKTISCIENTGAWDGAVPFVIGSPMSIPYALTCASHATRVLRNKLQHLAECMEPGGSKDPYQGLNEEETDALREFLYFGNSPRSLFTLHLGQDGALPVLAPSVKQADPTYFTDFWSVPGYLGADPNGSAVRDRVQFKAKIAMVHIPEVSQKQNWDDRTGVDDAWQRLMRKDKDGETYLMLEEMPDKNAFMYGIELIMLSGALVGSRLPIEKIEGNKIVLGGVFGANDILDELDQLKIGDELMLDNSDYIAMQTYHRHQIPENGYTIYDQYRDENGKPIYPQRSFVLGPLIAAGGAGSMQSGKINSKVILIAATLDGNLPWKAHWYRGLVQQFLGDQEEQKFRLWYVDNAVHSDESISMDPLHISGYFGVMNQALLDVSDWVMHGKAPHATTNYNVIDNQIVVPATAKDRKGIQPIVNLFVNGQEMVTICAGETAEFMATIDIPNAAGAITLVEWSFENEVDFPYRGEIVSSDVFGAVAKINHNYQNAGIYYAVVKVSIQRNNQEDDTFTQVKNLCRVRVNVI